MPHGPGVFWSLSIEEHFYLFWPLLVRFLRRPMVTAIAVAICILVPLARWYAKNAGVDPINVIYCVTWFRLDGLAMGALLAIWTRSQFATQRNALILAGLLFTAFILETVALMPLGILQSGSIFRYNQVHLFFAAFLAGVLALRDTVWTAPLRSGFARLSGDLSYCLYLIHLSVGDGYEALVAALGWNPGLALGDFGALAARTAFMLTVSFGLAMLSRHFLELPVLRLKDRFSYSKRPSV